MAGFLSSQIVMFNVQCSNAESAGRDSRYLGNKTIFDAIFEYFLVDLVKVSLDL